jgi:hypothetical protein
MADQTVARVVRVVSPRIQVSVSGNNTAEVTVGFGSNETVARTVRVVAPRVQVAMTGSPAASVSVGFGAPGPQGPQGAPGVASAQEYVVDQDISALRVVRATSIFGHVVYAQPGDTSLVGVSITAATSGGNVTVAGTDHIVEDSSWSWTPETPVFCGTDGVLTQTAPTSGVLMVVGLAHSSQILVVRFGQPIQLAS